MKKKRLGKWIVGLVVALGISGVALANAVDVEAAEMHRLYNPNSGEHFYTANTVERDKVKSAGWRYEGIGWTAPESGDPVYRLYNPNAGDHHYTLHLYEKNHLVKVGWKYEGIGWYSDKNKSIPLYRAYNPNAKAGSHNYTVNNNEQQTLLRAGWRNEGIAWYGVGKTTTPPKPTEPSKPKEPTVVSGYVGNTGKVFNTYKEAYAYGDTECLNNLDKYRRFVVITIVYSDGSEKYSVSLYSE
jgi:hypothetical protein